MGKSQTLQKGVYPCEHMDSWQKLNETLLLDKKKYSNLNMEYITDADHKHAKILCKDFKIKILGK